MSRPTIHPDDERYALNLFLQQFNKEYRIKRIREDDNTTTFDCDVNSCIGRTMAIWEERGYIEIIEKAKREKDKHHGFYTGGREMYYKVRITDIGFSVVEFDEL